MCFCLNVYMCTMCMQESVEVRRGIGSPGTAVTDICESHVGIGNGTYALCKSVKFS